MVYIQQAHSQFCTKKIQHISKGYVFFRPVKVLLELTKQSAVRALNHCIVSVIA